MAPRFLTIASAILVGLGVVLLGFYGASMLGASHAHQQGIDAFEAARETQRIRVALADPAPGSATTLAGSTVSEQPSRAIEANEAPDLSAGTPDMSLWSDKRIADYEHYGRAAAGPEVPEGILRIPSVNLELPVFGGTDEVNLTRGAGTIEGTAPLGAAGNTGIAGHRDGYFRALKDVSVGDSIVIETLAGTHDYRIDELLIVQPEDIYVLDPTDESVVTLVTCYPFYFVGSAPQRFIVRASKR